MLQIRMLILIECCVGFHTCFNSTDNGCESLMTPGTIL